MNVGNWGTAWLVLEIGVQLGSTLVFFSDPNSMKQTVYIQSWVMFLAPMNVFSIICGCKNIPMSVGHTNATIDFHDCGTFGCGMV